MKRIIALVLAVLVFGAVAAYAQNDKLCSVTWGEVAFEGGTVLKIQLSGVVGIQLDEFQASTEAYDMRIDNDGEIKTVKAIPVDKSASVKVEVIKAGKDELYAFPGGYYKEGEFFYLDGQAYDMNLVNAVGESSTYNFNLEKDIAVQLPFLDFIIVGVDTETYPLPSDDTNKEKSVDKSKETEQSSTEEKPANEKISEQASEKADNKKEITKATESDYYQYKIKEGDTLATIALNYYGSYKYSVDIFKINKEYFKKYKILYVGHTLNLDESKMIEKSVPTDNQTTYVVKAGDTLGGISQKVYGTPSKYNEILKLNPQIKNANLIFEGQEIIVPKK